MHILGVRVRFMRAALPNNITFVVFFLVKTSPDVLKICNILSWHEPLWSPQLQYQCQRSQLWSYTEPLTGYLCRHQDQTCAPFQSYIKHEICRLHSLIQGPTCSSLYNIASLAKHQNSICPDLVWTDKMCATGIELPAASAGTCSHDDAERGLFLVLFDEIKTDP